MADTTDLYRPAYEVTVYGRARRRLEFEMAPPSSFYWMGQDIRRAVLLNQIRAVVREEVQPIKETQQEQGKAMNALTEEVTAIRKEHGEKLDKLGEAVGRLEDGQNRQYTTMKVLQGAIEEAKAEVDKILRRPRQAD